MNILKQIKGFPGYFVSDTGEIYSNVFHPTHNPFCELRKLKIMFGPGGYGRISLKKGNTRYFYLIHRLVAEEFIPNPENKPQVNHKNGIKTDNRVENLEWCTAQENMRHASKNSLLKPAWLGKFGKEHHSSKPVIQIKGNLIVNNFYGITEAERATGINHRNISMCCSGKRKTAGGYSWKYKIKE